MSKPELGYWNIRGFAQPIRLLLQYAGVDYEDKLYGFGDGPDWNVDSWKSEKFNLGLDFPNVPYWIDDKVKLTESKAILRYVARTRASELYPQSAEDEAILAMVEGVMTDLQRALFTLAYTKTGVPEEPLETALAPKFKYLASFLENRRYVLGDNISYVDFYAYEVLVEFRKFNSEFLTPYPSLEKFMKNFESIPQLVEYIQGSNQLFCLSPFATIQF